MGMLDDAERELETRGEQAAMLEKLKKEREAQGAALWLEFLDRARALGKRPYARVTAKTMRGHWHYIRTRGLYGDARVDTSTAPERVELLSEETLATAWQLQPPDREPLIITNDGRLLRNFTREWLRMDDRPIEAGCWRWREFRDVPMLEPVTSSIEFHMARPSWDGADPELRLAEGLVLLLKNWESGGTR